MGHTQAGASERYVGSDTNSSAARGKPEEVQVEGYCIKTSRSVNVRMVKSSETPTDTES